MNVHYSLSPKTDWPHLLQVDLEIDCSDTESTILQLSAWRPGRYELANYAKNIVHFDAFSAAGEPLKWRKKNKTAWEIVHSASEKIKISYSYYCQQLDAGACWIDETLFYINPVNCLMYVDNPHKHTCTLALNLNNNWDIAWNLTPKNNIYFADSWEKLADSPCLAAPVLTHLTYAINQTEFHIWAWNGESLDQAKTLKHFSAFTENQLALFGDFPFNVYHFLLLFTPYTHYHGVEHLESTVIVLGPDTEINTKLYTELVGVSSHELFHTWNVKTIRPKEMLPYNYTEENYSELGYVYEGFTTYYGDLCLFRSNVLSTKEYFHEINTYLLRHSLTGGCENYSVAQSSFDTWVDGYILGTPNRKSSIYIEGALNAMILDLALRKSTQNKFTLDTLMQILYHDFGKKSIGYTRENIESILLKNTGIDWRNHFQKYFYTPTKLEEKLNESLDFIGCLLVKKDSKSILEKHLGVKLNPKNEGEVLFFAPNSPAAKLGISNGCIIKTISGHPISTLAAYETGNMEIAFIDGLQRLQKKIITQELSVAYNSHFEIIKNESANSNQKDNFILWSGNLH